MILVTGGAGFIGANFILEWLGQFDEPVVNLDKLTYAGNLQNLTSLQGDTRHIFVQGDICDSQKLKQLFDDYQPRAVIHFAAESHVDRSIHGPDDFIQTNIVGTFRLLEVARHYWNKQTGKVHDDFRFCMFLPMKFMVRLRNMLLRLLKNMCISPTVHIQRVKLQAII